jgi:hypothetical protein
LHRGKLNGHEETVVPCIAMCGPGAP